MEWEFCRSRQNWEPSIKEPGTTKKPKVKKHEGSKWGRQPSSRYNVPETKWYWKRSPVDLSQPPVPGFHGDGNRECSATCLPGWLTGAAGLWAASTVSLSAPSKSDRTTTPAPTLPTQAVHAPLSVQKTMCGLAGEEEMTDYACKDTRFGDKSTAFPHGLHQMWRTG